jgi:hypothetical protein
MSPTSWNSTTGFANTMTASGAYTNAYQAVGLTDPWMATAGNSENFANWSAARNRPFSESTPTASGSTSMSSQAMG